ncbi:MAG: type II toxin-antitoxin system RelE/ParE family toxin [Pseudomonadota bacterium]|nr:type II toxin-antitoxin system RelE/ParE family toxin [Pseudomonadota bacterium]
MAYRVVRAAGVAADLSLIFDFLFEAAVAFGETPGDAFARAEARLREIEDALDSLGDVPFQGTLRPDLGAGIRNVTKGRAVYYFDIDERGETVRVLAVFFGGQDHVARMLVRLLC